MLRFPPVLGRGQHEALQLSGSDSQASSKAFLNSSLPERTYYFPLSALVERSLLPHLPSTWSFFNGVIQSKSSSFLIKKKTTQPFRTGGAAWPGHRKPVCPGAPLPAATPLQLTMPGTQGRNCLWGSTHTGSVTRCQLKTLGREHSVGQEFITRPLLAEEINHKATRWVQRSFGLFMPAPSLPDEGREQLLLKKRGFPFCHVPCHIFSPKSLFPAPLEVLWPFGGAGSQQPHCCGAALILGVFYVYHGSCSQPPPPLSQPHSCTGRWRSSGRGAFPEGMPRCLLCCLPQHTQGRHKGSRQLGQSLALSHNKPN